MRFRLINLNWFQRFCKKKTVIPYQDNAQNSSFMAEEITNKTNGHIDSILYRLLRDEATIVRLIKQDILTSLLMQKTWSNDLIEVGGINEFEINQLIFELMQLDRFPNKEDVVSFYDKYIEDACKMLSDFPTMSKDELALNCYLEVKRKCKW